MREKLFTDFYIVEVEGSAFFRNVVFRIPSEADSYPRNDNTVLCMYHYTRLIVSQDLNIRQNRCENLRCRNISRCFKLWNLKIMGSIIASVNVGLHSEYAANSRLLRPIRCFYFITQSLFMLNCTSKHRKAKWCCVGACLLERTKLIRAEYDVTVTSLMAAGSGLLHWKLASLWVN